LGYIQLFTLERGWLEHSFLGVGIACLLIHFTERWNSGDSLPRLSPLRLLRTRAVVHLGIFSYSLYLVHAPILAALAIAGRDYLRLQGVSAYLFIFVVGIPATLLGSYLFHLAFERPFMPQSARALNRLSVGLENALPAIPADNTDTRLSHLPK
jgi:peptidoglycan/LPS O-acetylase OafA/YrhL